MSPSGAPVRGSDGGIQELNYIREERGPSSYGPGFKHPPYTPAALRGVRAWRRSRASFSCHGSHDTPIRASRTVRATSPRKSSADSPRVLHVIPCPCLYSHLHPCSTSSSFDGASYIRSERRHQSPHDLCVSYPHLPLHTLLTHHRRLPAHASPTSSAIIPPNSPYLFPRFDSSRPWHPSHSSSHPPRSLRPLPEHRFAGSSPRGYKATRSSLSSRPFHSELIAASPSSVGYGLSPELLLAQLGIGPVRTGAGDYF